MLYIVATPIGNLGDMVPRAVEALQSVDLILAEDTRHSKKLLQHFNIDTPMRAYHDHSEQQMAESFLERLRAGDRIALISDAGTPLIADPGYRLVRLAHEHSIRVVPIPGACAAIAALSAAGLPTDRFLFEGFLPAKAAAREQVLQLQKRSPCTLIYYESPHRITASLDAMISVFGAERSATLARELSKQFETIKAAPLADLKAFVEQDAHQQKGEFVVIVAPSPAEESGAIAVEDERVLDILLSELSVKQAAALAARITGKQKRRLYDMALQKTDKKIQE